MPYLGCFLKQQKEKKTTLVKASITVWMDIFKQKICWCLNHLGIASTLYLISICWDISTKLVYLKLKLQVICIQFTAEPEQGQKARQNWEHFIIKKEDDIIECHNQHDSRKTLFIFSIKVYIYSCWVESFSSTQSFKRCCLIIFS